MNVCMHRIKERETVVLKRTRILLLMAFLFVFLFCAAAETTEFAGGGVVERKQGNYRVRGLIEELDVAYLVCDSAYLSEGKQAKWTVVASGGDGVYSYAFSIYHRSGTSGWFSFEASQALSGSNEFYHTPKQAKGQYLVEVSVYDSSGAYIKWQSLVYETDAGEGSAAQKAQQIVDECLLKAGKSDYAKALWLHDWLILNADYDYTYQYYYADGVLLHGTGVCQSYALAYDMMLKMAGIDCLYITGEAGGESHAWNLVRLEGEWYHVDVTWDDPAPGSETRKYFCVTDEIMRKDHTWEKGSGVMPECSAEEYLYAGLAAAVNVSSAEELRAELNALASKKKGYAEFICTDEEKAFDMESALSVWLSYDAASKGVQRVEYAVDGSWAMVKLDFGKGFPDSTQAQCLFVAEEHVHLEAGDTYALTVQTLPAAASRENITYTSENEAAVKVNGGVLTALAPGFSVITVSLPNGENMQVEVWVKTAGVLLIPSGTKVIEEEAFALCTSLQKVCVPSGAETISKGAFSGCESLVSILIPESVTEISPDAFTGCTRLVILGEAGSYAEAYALEHNISFEIITESTLNSD